MTRWTGIVLALPDTASEEMSSRLVTYLHPVAGRPLVWHIVSSLAGLSPPPDRVLLAAGVDLSPELFQDIPVEVEVLRCSEMDLAHMEEHLPVDDPGSALVIDATSWAPPESLQALLEAPTGWWLDAGKEAAAATMEMAQLPQLFRLPEPLRPPNGVLAEQNHLAHSDPGALVVRNRAELAVATRAIRDRIVRTLMNGGVTFLLPDSVLVDVDVRIGRDSVIYPGVVLEGQTTVGDETVVGPGCRIIDSWVGSGVELKGWNYVAHTSIRNRAILEPYVRRGFD